MWRERYGRTRQEATYSSSLDIAARYPYRTKLHNEPDMDSTVPLAIVAVESLPRCVDFLSRMSHLHTVWTGTARLLWSVSRVPRN